MYARRQVGKHDIMSRHIMPPPSSPHHRISHNCVTPHHFASHSMLSRDIWLRNMFARVHRRVWQARRYEAQHGTHRRREEAQVAERARGQAHRRHCAAKIQMWHFTNQRVTQASCEGACPATRLVWPGRCPGILRRRMRSNPRRRTLPSGGSSEMSASKSN